MILHKDYPLLELCHEPLSKQKGYFFGTLVFQIGWHKKEPDNKISHQTYVSYIINNPSHLNLSQRCQPYKGNKFDVNHNKFDPLIIPLPTFCFCFILILLPSEITLPTWGSITENGLDAQTLLTSNSFFKWHWWGPDTALDLSPYHPLSMGAMSPCVHSIFNF